MENGGIESSVARFSCVLGSRRFFSDTRHESSVRIFRVLTLGPKELRSQPWPEIIEQSD